MQRAVVSDLIHTVTVTPATQPGTPLAIVDLNPSTFVNTHIGTMAQAYELYRWRSLSLRIIPQVPSVVGGGYAAAIVADPPEDVEDRLRHGGSGYIMAHAGAVMNSLWSPATCTFNAQRSRLNAYLMDATEAEQGVASQATMVMNLTSAMQNVFQGSNNAVSIQVIVNGTCELSRPTTRPLEGGGPSDVFHLGGQGTLTQPSNPGRAVLQNIFEVDGGRSQGLVNWSKWKYDVLYAVLPELVHGGTIGADHKIGYMCAWQDERHVEGGLHPRIAVFESQAAALAFGKPSTHAQEKSPDTGETDIFGDQWPRQQLLLDHQMLTPIKDYTIPSKRMGFRKKPRKQVSEDDWEMT